MNQKGKKQMNEAFSEICKKIYVGIVTAAVLCVLTIFPLYYRDYYFDILPSKYQFYYVTMIALFVILILASIIFAVIDGLEYKLIHTKTFLKKFSLINLKDTLSWTDWFLIVFLGVGIISTMQSDYVYESFWGNEGRFTGLFLHLIYGIGFLIISRLYNLKKWHLYAFLAVAMLPLLFGITDFFRMDLLGFKVDIAAGDADRFVSTFGNVNTYTTYVGLIFGALAVLFTRTEKRILSILSYIGLVISMFALIMGISDNSYLAFFAVFGFLPLYAFLSKKGFCRYFLLLATFFAVVQCIHLIVLKKGDTVLEINGVFQMLAGNKPGILLFAGSWIFTAAVYFICFVKMKTQNEWGSKAARVWMGVIAAGIVCLLFILFDANIRGNAERYGSLSSYVVFNDNWGNHRGYIWRSGMEAYQKQPVLHKLFGYGLDTFGIFVYGTQGEANQLYGEVFDSAHNEYLQYFFTMGFLGIIAYGGFLISWLIRMVRRCKNNLPAMAVVYGVLCYLAQAFVTINLPIVTPIFWMLLSVGMAVSNQAEREK